MAVTNFDTINGKIMGQHSVAFDGTYFLDPLGSVVAAKVNKNTVVNTTYTPLGQGSAPGGVTFGWVGGWGYRRTNGPSGLDHVRRRHMPEQESRWLSRDSKWPSQRAFSYVEGRPLLLVDPKGTETLPPWAYPPGTPFPTPLWPPQYPPPAGPGPCDNSCKGWNEYVYQYCNKCWTQTFPDPSCIRNCNDIAYWYYTACKYPGRPRYPGETWEPIRPVTGPLWPRRPGPIGWYPPPGDGGPVIGVGKNPGVEPVYGNYCGPQTEDGTGPGVDALDGCCKTHDECFAQHGCNAFNQCFFNDCKQCTNDLCTCMKNAILGAIPGRPGEASAGTALMAIYCHAPFTNWPLYEFGARP
jgi:hypothetical protein